MWEMSTQGTLSQLLRPFLWEYGVGGRQQPVLASSQQCSASTNPGLVTEKAIKMHYTELRLVLQSNIKLQKQQN